MRNVTPRFCRSCASHFCPHATPHLYSKEEASSYLDEVKRLRREKLVLGPRTEAGGDAP